jgi:hypothetical protein
MLSATVHSGEGMWVKDGRGDPVLCTQEPMEWDRFMTSGDGSYLRLII